MRIQNGDECNSDKIITNSYKNTNIYKEQK